MGNPINEAIILAGGLGTRLRSVVSDSPKCMAIVNGKPFLQYVIDYLFSQNIIHVILSIGYKSEQIIKFVNHHYANKNIEFVIEEEPLGTGAAIKLALVKTISKNVFILNGDTFFKINFKKLEDVHFLNTSTCTLALKPMKNFERYGVVELDKNSKIISFKEKQFYKTGFINAGVYILNKEIFLKQQFPEKFSFEKEFLEKNNNKMPFYGCTQNEYFIDIGIPEDFQKAQTDFKKL